MTICNDLDYFLRHRLFVPQELCKRGHRTIVLSGGRPMTEILGEQIEFHHVEISRFNFNPIKDLIIVWKVASSIIKYRPESIHLITLKPAIYAGMSAAITRTLTRSPLKVLITIPGLGRLLSPDSKLNGLKARAARRLSLTVLKMLGRRSFVHFTFETDHDRDAMSKYGVVNEINSTVIAGAGVDSEIYRPFGETERSEKTKVLFASRLLRSKGIETFIKAAEINSRRNEIEFLVAGIEDKSDPDAFDASKLVSSNAVSYIGEETEMASLLKQVDIVCLPTLYGEGIPRILIEAAACGLPTIATQHPGCMEITKDLHTGVLIPISDMTTMAMQINRAVEMYADNRALMIEHGINARMLFEAGGYSKAVVTGTFMKLLGIAAPH